MDLINQNYIDTDKTCLELTLNRPEALNALNMPLLGDLEKTLQNLPKILKILVIRGSGTKAFSAGADLKERSHMTLDETRGFLKKINRVFDLVENLRIPTIAYLNGLALGGGLELALSCDMRVMAPHAQVGLTECALGIIPGAGGTGRLPKIIGYARACELIFCAKKIDAAEALKLGLTNQIADSANELALQIAKHPKSSIQAAKEAMKTGKESECYEQVLGSPERAQALEAFMKKTSHRWP